MIKYLILITLLFASCKEEGENRVLRQYLGKGRLSDTAACKKKGYNPLSRAHYYEERIAMFMVDYHRMHDYYPSYYIRERYYEHKDDDTYVDSLIYKTEK